MAQILQNSPRDSTIGASSTIYTPTGSGGGTASLTVESQAQLTTRTPGTHRNLFTNIITNATTGSSSITFRKNTANGNMNISIGAGATGEMTDAVNTDSVVAGDILDYQITAAAGGSLRFGYITTLFTPSSTLETVNNMHNTGTGVSTATQNTTWFLALSGGPNLSATTEAWMQVKNKAAAKLRNLYCTVSVNGRGTSSTIKSRKNSADGNLLITIGAAATGVFEDSSNSDTLAVDDLMNLSFTNAAGAGTITVTVISVDYVTSNGTTHYIASNSFPNTLSISSDSREAFASGLQINSTDGVVRQKVQIPMVLNNMQVYISVNTLTDVSTATSRVNSAAGNMSVTIGIGATGYFEDVTNRDVLSAADYYNFRIVAGATGTSMTMTMFSFFAEFFTEDKWEPTFNDIVWKKKPIVPVGHFAYPFGFVTNEVVLLSEFAGSHPDFLFRRRPVTPATIGWFALFPQGTFFTVDMWKPHFPDRVWKAKPLVPIGHFSYPFGFVTAEVISSDKWTPQYPNYVWKARRLQPGLQLIAKQNLVPSLQILYFSPDDLFNFFAT